MGVPPERGSQRGPGDDLLPVVTLRALNQDMVSHCVPRARQVVRRAGPNVPPPSEGLELGSVHILPTLNAMTFTEAQALAVTRVGSEDSAALSMGLA